LIQNFQHKLRFGKYFNFIKKFEIKYKIFLRFQNRRIKWRKHHLEITQQHLAIARQRQLPLPQIPSTSKEEDSIHSDGQIVSDADD
jgi:hypothetical protein